MARRRWEAALVGGLLDDRWWRIPLWLIDLYDRDLPTDRVAIEMLAPALGQRNADAQPSATHVNWATMDVRQALTLTAS